MKLFTKILLIFLSFYISSCNLYRKIPQDQYLLRKNEIKTDGKKVKKEAVTGLILLQPNTTFLGYPYLADLYMLADQHPNQTFVRWIKKHPKNYQLLKKIISRKQIIQLQYYYRDINKTIKNIGEPPVFIDTSKIKLSANLLKNYYVNHAYLDAKSKYKIDTIGKHKAKVTYLVKKGQPYIINKYEQNIQSPYLVKLYQKYKKKSPIKPGKPYNREAFVKEKENLNTLFRNKGVYHFQPSYINYDLVFDSLPNKRQIEAYLNIPDRIITKTDTVYTEPFLPYRIKNVNIYISKTKDFDFQNKQDSVTYEGMHIYSIDDRLRYRPKLLTQSVFVKPGRLYSDQDRLRTHRLLMSLQNFKQAYIQYDENKIDTTLTANIFLIPEKRFNWKGSVDVTHSNIHDFGIKGSMSFSAKNLFRGAEVLSTSLYFMTASSTGLTDKEQLFDVSEFGADVTLRFPRLLLPFGLSKYIPKHMLPKTYITFLSNTQNNIGLDRNKYAGIFGFEWRPIKERKFKIDLLNYMFITNKKAYKYFEIYTLAYNQVEEIANQLGQQNLTPQTASAYLNSLYLQVNQPNSTFCQNQTEELCQEILNVKEREQRITQNIFILSNKFDFYYDSRKHLLQPDFYLFNSTFELAGSLLSVFSRSLSLPKNELGQYTINNVPYAEYFKTDLSLVKHWQLHKEHILAYRAFIGYAIPYGNSESVPFISSYFAGGSNDIRGWRAYSLGPGTSGSPNEFNEANFKLTTNIEYRFPIAGYFKGALFTDAGNIWNIDNGETDPKSSFKGLSSLKDIAIASGFGLRVDFTYFVIRFDLGYKVYNPAKEGKDRWIDLKNTKLADGVLNIGISYPF